MRHLLVLHGAIGSSLQLQPLTDALSKEYIVLAPDFPGHGMQPMTADFSIPRFAEFVIEYLDVRQISNVSILGYSMGGYVGLYLARHYPGRVGALCTLATKFHWDEATAAKEVQNLNPGKILQKVPAFADTLMARHAATDWKDVLSKTASMMLDLGKTPLLAVSDYEAVTIPVQLLIGDRDKMVSLDETLAVYKALPSCRLGVLPATPHPIEQVNPRLVASLLREFLA